ncbi:MAG: hypothetical protein ABW221_03355 [Vicinamibacteria bacterium]
MKVLSAVLLASAVAAPAVRTEASGTSGDLVVTFVTDGVSSGRGSAGALVDLGSVSAAFVRGRGPAAAAIEKRLGVRVEAAGRRGFVRLRAFLSAPEPGRVVSVDGIVLSAAPRIVDAQAPIGSTVGHVVRVDVPPSQPAGAFATDIVWEVEEP